MAKSLDSEAHEERERERIAGLEEDIETLRAKLEAAESALAPLRAVVEAVTSFLASWPEAERAINACCAISAVHGLSYQGPSLDSQLRRLRESLDALHADPSAPTPR